MSLTISKETTPVLNQQPEAIQQLCRKAYTEYHGQNSVAIRVAQGKFFDAIIRHKDLRCVDADGKSVQGSGNTSANEMTFSAICDELNIPRSTAYNYADECVVTQSYPVPIQEAAKTLNVNLANEKIQGEYTRLQGAGQIPVNLDSLQAEALVARIKKAVKAPPKPRKTAEQRLQEMLKEAFEFAKAESLDKRVVATSVRENGRYFTVSQSEWDTILADLTATWADRMSRVIPGSEVSSASQS